MQVIAGSIRPQFHRFCIRCPAFRGVHDVVGDAFHVGRLHIVELVLVRCRHRTQVNAHQGRGAAKLHALANDTFDIDKVEVCLPRE